MGIAYKKDRNKYEAWTYVDGKRVKKLFNTELEAKAWEQTFNHKVKQQHSGDLYELIHRYVDTFTARKNKRSCDKMFFNRFFEYCQDHNVNHIAQVDLLFLQKYQTFMVKSCKLANSSVNREFNTLKHFFNECRRWGAVSSSPASDLKSLPESRSHVKRKIWTDSQIELAIHTSTGWLKDFIMVVAFTGLRPIEVCRLTWEEHIDFSDEVIKAVSFKGQGEEMVRYIPVDSSLLVMLKKRKLASKSKYVFTSERGAPLSTQVVARKFREEVVSRLKLKDYGLYGMRHSFATRMLNNGVNLNEVRELMGHTNLNTTQVYLHHTKDRLKKAASISSQILKIK